MLIENMFSSLFKSSNFFRIVYPHIKPEYLSDRTDKILFETIQTYYNTYNKQGSISDVKLLVETNLNISEEDTDTLFEKLSQIKQIEQVQDEQLLIDQVEEWCKNRALELAILSSVDIIQKNQNKGLIEDKIKEALSVQFDVKIGHDYEDDVVQRLKWYMSEEETIPLDIEYINAAMGGGLVRNAMFIFMGNTNIGKSLWNCHIASSLVRSGKNVLYCSGEMHTQELGKRIDANLLDLPIDALSLKIDKQKYKESFKNLLSKTHGKLIIKSYPTCSASSVHIKNLLHELKIKKHFIPDVLILDGLNNFGSSKLPAAQTGTHLYVKSVAEEMRALCVEFGFALLTVAQFNRNAKSKNSDVSTEDVAEGYAISQTADWAGAIIQNDELRNMSRYILKCIKTRFGSNNGTTYTIGIDYEKMRLVNLSDDQQEIPLHIKDQIKFSEKQKQEKETSTMFDFGE
jgi:archaellum biogenesis ATPase FlaH